MKKKILLLAILSILLMFAFTGCGDDNECGMCNGSGYYDHRTCPACKGSGESDFDPYEIADEVYGEDDDDGSTGAMLLVIGGIILFCVIKANNKQN